MIEVALGPAAAELTVFIEHTVRDDPTIFERQLGVPAEVPFEIYPTPRSPWPKVQAITDKEGVCVLSRGAQLYVGRTYTLEVTKATSLEPFSTTFEVYPGEQTLRLTPLRCGAKLDAFVLDDVANTKTIADDGSKAKESKGRVTTVRSGKHRLI